MFKGLPTLTELLVHISIAKSVLSFVCHYRDLQYNSLEKIDADFLNFPMLTEL